MFPLEYAGKMVHHLPFAEKINHLYFYQKISASQQTFVLPVYHFTFRVWLYRLVTKTRERIMERHIQQDDTVWVSTSWGKYTLGIILLEFDPRHSNRVDRLICIEVIKSTYHTVHFRRIKNLWMFLVMRTNMYPSIRFEIIEVFFQD